MFITNKERIGTCYLEFQFCKNDKPIKIVKVDIDIIDNWKEDSLLVSDDDFNEFYKLYGKFLNLVEWLEIATKNYNGFYILGI